MATQTLFKVDSNLVKITIHFGDKSMVADFYKFLLNNGIAPAVNGNDAGNYKFHGFFTQEDADKIIDFLKENNCRKCQILPS